MAVGNRQGTRSRLMSYPIEGYCSAAVSLCHNKQHQLLETSRTRQNQTQTMLIIPKLLLAQFLMQYSWHATDAIRRGALSAAGLTTLRLHG
jgi:hypothetical protein